MIASNLRRIADYLDALKNSVLLQAKRMGIIHAPIKLLKFIFMLRLVDVYLESVYIDIERRTAGELFEPGRNYNRPKTFESPNSSTSYFLIHQTTASFSFKFRQALIHFWNLNSGSRIPLKGVAAAFTAAQSAATNIDFIATVYIQFGRR